MKRMLLVASTMLILAAAPALAANPRHHPRGGAAAPEYSFGFGLRVGLFEPDGDSDFWDDSFDVFTGNIGDYEDTNFSVDLSYALNSRLSVIGTVGSFEGDSRRGYRDAEFDPFLIGVIHRSELQLTPITIGFQAHLLGPEAMVRPYVGAGAGFYWWNYNEIGDFVDFGDPIDPADDTIITTRFESDGTTLGYYLQAGIEVALTPNWSIVAEGRWHRAEDELSDDFDGFGDLDLSGREVSLGMIWRF